MIGVIDYGAGNVRSVCNALRRQSIPFEVCETSFGIEKADSLILPGVGHFGNLADALDRKDLRAAIVSSLHGDKPFLGICLGMQILFDESEECPAGRGLGFFEGYVTKIDAPRIPHIGWNVIELSEEGSCMLEPDYFYFAHSFAVASSDASVATCCYGAPFVAAVQRKNVFGVQFHPEKSGDAGARLLKRFAEKDLC